MKKFIYLIAFAFILSCSKDNNKPSRYPEPFSISFKIDGKSYSKTLKQDELHFVTYSGGNGSNGAITYNLGPVFETGPLEQIYFTIGNYHHLNNDTAGNMARLKYLCRPGNKTFICFNQCDTAAIDAVQVNFMDDPQGVIYWSSTKRKMSGGVTVQASADQPNGEFKVTEVIETPTTGSTKNAVIIKGTFKCTLWEVDTENSKQLTDGQFTCLIPAL